jgi:hypothetical protein
MNTERIIPIKIAYDSLGQTLPLFKNKQRYVNGISIMVTNDCNLKCDFCLERFYENFDSDIQTYCDGVFLKKYNYLSDSISVDIVNRTKENTLKVIRALDGSEYYNMSILGGELFQDKFKSEIYQAYDDLLESCISQIRQQGGKYQWALMTNLITKHPERIIDLAIKHRCTINASFDFEGRFKTAKTLDLWLKNIETVKRSGASYLINTCMSKANIEHIMDHDPLWVDLYNNHTIHLEQYQDVGDDKYSVSSKLLTDLYIFLYENYPKITNIISEQQFFATCVSVFPNNISWQCCDHFKMMQQFFEMKQCLTCEYFDQCEIQDCYLVFANDNDCYIRDFKNYLKIHAQPNRDMHIRVNSRSADNDMK